MKRHRTKNADSRKSSGILDGATAARTRVAVVTRQIWRIGVGRNRISAIDRVVVESPLELKVRGHSVAVTMRTPGHDRELAAGFLLTERVIRKPSELIGIAQCRASRDPANALNVFLAAGTEVDFASLTRHVFTASSCGICGKAAIESLTHHFPPVESAIRMARATLTGLPQRMRRAQRAFAQTGGLHAAALFNARGKLIVLREDVGRHNAVDKVIGHGLLKRILPFDQHVLLVSGRVSFEIMQKALAARIPIVCAVSAPSSLAVEFAEQSAQTLVGFLRDGACNIYTHPERLR